MSSALYRGDAFRELIDNMRTLVDRQSSRLLNKDRAIPGVRIREYIELQSSKTVRDSLERLTGGRVWRYVGFREFRDALFGVARRVFEDLRGSNVCFVVDSLRKSSLWVVAMSLLEIPPESWDRLSLVVGDENGGLTDALGRLLGDPTGNQTRFVLMDDATYSGDQLSYFHDAVLDAWREAKGREAKGREGRGGPRIDVVVPFMSAPSVPLFTRDRGRGGLTRLTHAETFPSLFYRRSLATVLASDVYLMRSSAFATECHSLYFDFLGVLPTNTLVIFEHKVADSLSIPNRWLQLGPCLRPSEPPARAFRLDPAHVDALAKLLRKDILERRIGSSWDNIADHGPGTAAQRTMLAASRRLCELMQISRFRKRYALPASLALDREPPPAYFPLIPVEFCDPRYRRFVRSKLRRIGSSTIASSIIVADEMPPCRRPPYKRSSFRRRLVPRRPRDDRMLA